MEESSMNLSTLDSSTGSMVPAFHEIETEVESSDEHSVPKKRCRKLYDVTQIFETETEVEDYLKTLKMWSKKKIVDTEEGVKKFFRCNQVKSRGPQCKASMYLLYEATSYRVLVYESEGGHSCNEMTNKAGNLMTPEIKKEIERLANDGKKPLAIMDHLNKMGVAMPKKYQINNYLSKFKKEKFGPSTVSVSCLMKMIEKYKEVSTTNFETPYFITDCNTDVTSDAKFRFFVTSKGLMEAARGVKHLHADATYKLLWQGFPVLIVGTTDMDRKFHILGFAVCNNEAEEDFKFIFNSVKKCGELFLGETIAPTVLMSDAAKAIQNAFKSVFGAQTTILMCWAHMIKNVKKRLEKEVKCDETRKKIMGDIHFLQIVSSPSAFETGRRLFLEEWSSHTEFIEYFKSEWCTKNPNWYEGAQILVPSTNNALEATNRVIKDSFTNRKRLTLGEFISVLTDMVASYSRRSKSDLIFVHKATISDETWSLAYNWAKQTEKLQKKKNADGEYIQVHSSESSPDTFYVETEWVTLREFRDFYNSKWVITKKHNDPKWIDGSCTCPSYQKLFVCKHVVGIAILYREVVVPEVAITTQIGSKRKAGRPAKAKKAYIVQ